MIGDGGPAVSKGRGGVLLGICGISFLVNFGRVAFAPLVDHFIAMGAAPAVAGLLATAVWLGSAAPRLPTGYILTFTKRHTVVLAAGTGLGLTAAVTALAPGVSIAILGAFALGISTGVFFVAANPLVAELFPRHLGVALGLRGTFSQIGAVVAPLAVTIAIGLGSWRFAFTGLAVGAVIMVAASVVAVARADLPHAGRGDRSLFGGITAEWQLIVAGLGFVGVTGFVWQGVFNFYLTFLGAEGGVSPATASHLLTLTFAAGIPSFLVFGRLADHVSFLRLLFTILSLFAGTLYLLTLVDGLAAVAVVSIVMGFIIHGLFPVGDAYMLASLPDERRGSAYAGFSAAMMLTQAPGSVAFGLLREFGLTYGAVFRAYALAVGGVVVLMSMLALSGRLPTGERSFDPG